MIRYKQYQLYICVISYQPTSSVTGYDTKLSMIQRGISTHAKED